MWPPPLAVPLHGAAEHATHPIPYTALLGTRNTLGLSPGESQPSGYTIDPPVRAFCPLCPRPAVLPFPEPTPRPTRLACEQQSSSELSTPQTMDGPPPHTASHCTLRRSGIGHCLAPCKVLALVPSMTWAGVRRGKADMTRAKQASVLHCGVGLQRIESEARDHELRPPKT